MTPPPSHETSRREYKKAQTRETLILESQSLFATRGYSATTLEDIATRAGITVQTLLRYFDSKAHLALTPLSAPLEHFERSLVTRDHGLDTLSAWRLHVESEALGVAKPSEGSTLTYLTNLRAYQDWDRKDPALVAALSDVDFRLQECLSRSLALDAGVAPDDLHSTLVAAMLVAGRRAIWNHWLVNGGDTATLVSDHMAVIEQAASLPRRVS